MSKVYKKLLCSCISKHFAAQTDKGFNKPVMGIYLWFSFAFRFTLLNILSIVIREVLEYCMEVSMDFGVIKLTLKYSPLAQTPFHW